MFVELTTLTCFMQLNVTLHSSDGVTFFDIAPVLCDVFCHGDLYFK